MSLGTRGPEYVDGRCPRTLMAKKLFMLLTVAVFSLCLSGVGVAGGAWKAAQSPGTTVANQGSSGMRTHENASGASTGKAVEGAVTGLNGNTLTVRDSQCGGRAVLAKSSQEV